jgi:hypothetical protein
MRSVLHHCVENALPLIEFVIRISREGLARVARGTAAGWLRPARAQMPGSQGPESLGEGRAPWVVPRREKIGHHQ